MMADLLSVDARQAVRAFGRQKGLALGAVGALALGIGATTTMFSIVHGGTRNLPFDQAHELVAITGTRPQDGIFDMMSTLETYNAIVQQQVSFEGVAAFRDGSYNLSGSEARPERRSGAAITPNTFTLLGVSPALGRGFTAADAQPGAESVVLLSHELWQARYTADAGIIGNPIRIDGKPRTVIGVMPPRFGFPVSAKLWIPQSVEPFPAYRQEFRIFGRLRDGISLEQARSELTVIGRRLPQTTASDQRGLAFRILPFVQLELDATIARFLYLMLGAVSFVLVIACANVANLLLARAATRTREVAIRTALGAARSRIAAQHLMESLLIAIGGGVLGVLAAYAGVGFFARATSNILEAFWMEFTVDRSVLLFAFSITLFAAVAAGLIPALQASRAQPAGVLKDESQGSSSLRLGRFSRALVVVQVALACGLLVTASVFIQAALSLRTIRFPFDTMRVLTAELGASDRLAIATSRETFLRELTERVTTLPGVRGFAVMSALPGRGAGAMPFAREHENGVALGQLPRAGLVTVTPGFLEVLEARVLRGRDLNWSDYVNSAPGMLVNLAWVARFSSVRDPIGRQIRVGERSYTVVGVVPDLHMQDLGARDKEGMYVTELQAGRTPMRVVARVSGAPLALLGPIRDAVEAIEPDLPVFEAMTLDQAIYSQEKVLDAFAWLFFAFGLGALLLTVTGLYGVVAFGVSSRTRELGIRRALGAQRADIIALVIRQGVGQLVLGFLIGSTIAFGLGRAAAHALELIDGVDLRAFGLVLGALAATGLAALFTPARRAAAVEPLVAFRHVN